MSRASLFFLLAAVGLLITAGLIMLASTSYQLDDAGVVGYPKLRQQTGWLVASIVFCVLMARADYNVLYRVRWWVFGICAFLLLCCFVPFLAEEVKGARRWLTLRSIGLSFVHFQPSEFAKIACCIVLAGWYARNEPLTLEFKSGFLIPGALGLVLVGLTGAEVDLGSASLLALLSLGLMFVAGARLRFLVPSVLTGAVGLVSIVKLMPNRVERIMAFQNLEKYKDGLGLQQWRALFSWGSGGLYGLGLGNGRQKNGFIPEAHTDFIFPMIGEELGLVGSLIIVALFVMLIASGMWIASNAPNRFGRLLGFGIVLTFAMEALLNMGVTTAMLPNKGLPLPFVSYGGSSLLAALIGVGVLINIHRQSNYEAKKDLLQLGRRRMTAPS